MPCQVTLAPVGVLIETDLRDRLFNRYLAFWDRGGFDKDRGGFMCTLNDDGSVASDEKFIWYQGRAIWIYFPWIAEFACALSPMRP